MHKFHLLVFGVLLLGGLASCNTQNIDPNGTAATLVADRATINTYAVSKGLSGTSTASGLYFVSSKPSSSTVVPAFGKELEFTYTLSALLSTTTNAGIVTAKTIDSAYAKTPAFVSFFDGVLKAGLQEGLLLMHEGESAIFLVPSKLAFGEVGSSIADSIPANTPVRFDVTLNRARTEDQQISEYIAANKLTFTETTASGLRFVRTQTSTSVDSVKTAVSEGKTVTVRYVGRQLHAKTALGFDSTGTGLNQYNVPGFTEGLNKLRVGEKATLLFPSSIGYGNDGLADPVTKLYKVAPYAPLRYDVEVVSVK
ncbi:FKBP-type peptidyl-prolyl cis-trans isomerase [Spirosoma luteum]|uniref:FKBP-type peptidyl-prolyl cis-trans isomerase n=1 Tax=Spirosoma luteum TaxID=431553 RepID=UPI000366C1EB|nr:FKBP-type peptidyl-prolyl cis-trans isomerase [Spirosoma luteum]